MRFDETHRQTPLAALLEKIRAEIARCRERNRKNQFRAPRPAAFSNASGVMASTILFIQSAVGNGAVHGDEFAVDAVNDRRADLQMHVRGAALDRRFENAMKYFHAARLTEPVCQNASRENAGDFSPSETAINPRMSEHRIGIIGGTGLYDIEGFTNQKWVKVKTPFGPPSDDLLTGKLGRARCRFSAAARTRPPHSAQRTESSRQHLGDEKTRRRNGSSASAPSARCRKNTSRATSCVVDQFLDRTKQSAEPHVFRTRHRGARRVCAARFARNCGKFFCKPRATAARRRTTAALM